MIEFITKITEMVVNEDETDKLKKSIYWIKSLIFLALFVILITNFYFDVKECVNNLLSDYIQIKILNFSKLATHFFVTLTIISMIGLAIFTIRLFLPSYKNETKQKYNINFGRGFLIRCSNSIENAMIFSLICYFIDDNFFSVFAPKHRYIDWLIFSFFIVQFRISIYRGIEKRFIISNSEVDIIEKMQ